MNEVKFKANIKDLASLQATVSEIPEIPTPETTDEGKVLTVSVDSSGETPVAEYDLATDKIYFIGASRDESTGIITLDKTAQEIATAMTNKMLCYVMMTEGNSSEGFYKAIRLGSGEWDDTGAGFNGYDCYNVTMIYFGCDSLSDYPNTATE